MNEAVVIFPGQGAQFEGMGRDWCDAFPEARETFAEADEILGFPLPGNNGEDRSVERGQEEGAQAGRDHETLRGLEAAGSPFDERGERRGHPSGDRTGGRGSVHRQASPVRRNHSTVRRSASSTGV